MKLYVHIIIIASLILFTMFFYREGLGAISFLLATAYLLYLLVCEFRKTNR